jgi:hypothetical protein
VRLLGETLRMAEVARVLERDFEWERISPRLCFHQELGYVDDVGDAVVFEM